MLTKRQKLLSAGLGSALIHAALLLAFGVIMARYPSDDSSAAPEPMRLEMVASEPPEPSAAPTPEHVVVDNEAMSEAAHPTADADFQGARDTVAGSEGPAMGDKPLPTQKGRQAPTYVFDPTPPAPPAPPQDVPPPPTVPPTPAPARRPVQPPMEPVAPTLVRNELAMLDTQPTPPPEELNPYDPSFRSTVPPPPVPVRPTPKPAYRPLEAQTASSGSIATAGPTGVNAAATPYGRYVNSLVGAVRTVWTREIDARSDIAKIGTVKCHFAVDRTGHVHTPRILANSANEALASLALEAVTSARIPPIPPEVVETMDGAMMQLDVTFECL